jgi:hypothetical protein
MVDQLIRTIIEHPKRKMLVIILTAVMGVMFGLPAVEEYSAARHRTALAREKLKEASSTAANLPQLQAALEKRKIEVQDLERKAVTDKDVERLRVGEFQKLIRDAGCEMREVKIDDQATKRDWRSNDSPLRGSPIGDPGQETPFVLMQWTARLHIEGPIGNVYKFLQQLGQMDRFIHTTKVEMQRSERSDDMTQLKMEIMLFDLVRKKNGKAAA